jgi:hypothetical protein
MKSLKHDGMQYALRFSEKGGKSREIPVRHDPELILCGYVEAAGIIEGPLFRTAFRRTGELTAGAMSGIDICRMLKRRLRTAGLPEQFSLHSFRVATVTDLLVQNVPLEDVQHLAGHADPRTTRFTIGGGGKSRGTSWSESPFDIIGGPSLCSSSFSGFRDPLQEVVDADDVHGSSRRTCRAIFRAWFSRAWLIA